MGKMRIKVGMISKFPPEKSGTAITTQYLVNALNKKCKVVRIGFGNSNCEYKVKFSSNFIEDVRNIVEKENLDVVHLQYTPSSRYLGQENKITIIGYLKSIMVNLELAKLMSSLGIPTVLTIHDMHPSAKNLKQAITKWLEKKMTLSSTAVIVHTMIQKGVIEKYGAKVVCIHHGVISINRKPVKGRGILFFGLISPTKGVEYLIEAMKYLPDFSLKIAGEPTDSRYAGKLKSIVSTNNLSNVELSFGWVSEEDKDKLYREYNIFALPYTLTSRYIVSGALHDAIAYSMPVVATDIGGMGEMVKKFKCGVAVKPFSAEELASGFKEVHKNYRTYLNGVNKYGKDVSWVKIAEQHLRLYKDLINKGRKV